jgi:hypothetical protein
VDGTISSLRVAPDGERIGFFEYSGEGARVVVLDRGGARASPEPIWSVTSGGLAWSADGREVWFTASEGWGPAKLLAYRPGGAIRQVLHLPGGMRLHDIASDGRVLLAFWNYRISMHSGHSSGAEVRDLSWFGWSFAGDLSADGRTLLFADLTSELPGAGFAWFLRPLSGGPALQLVRASDLRFRIHGAKLSPDAGSVAVPSRDGSEILVTPVGPGEAEVVCCGPEVRFRDCLSWLPDGRGFLFIGDNGEGPAEQVYLQVLDGSPPRALWPAMESNLVLSADGAATIGRVGESRLRIVTLADGSTTEVTTDAPLGRLIRASGDGEAVYFYRKGEIPGGLYRVLLDSGEVNLVSRLMPPDRAGVWRVHPVLVSADGHTYVYSSSRWMSDLYVYHGLR